MNTVCLDRNRVRRVSASLPDAGLTAWQVRAFALMAGLVVANIYYAQPIIERIAPDLGISLSHAGMIVSLTQIGYALGLFLLVPLGDLFENRRLIVGTVMLTAVALAAAALAPNGSTFLAASVVIGLSSVAVQMLVPLAAHLTPEAERGRTVGNIMGGLLTGILLARPLASLVTDHLGWRPLFGAAALAMIGVVLIVLRVVPRRQPAAGPNYVGLLRSLITLLREQPLLRQRSLYQATLFGAFSLFWTAVPLELASRHNFSQTQIAFFALIGAAGVVSGPLGGRLADRGLARPATLFAMFGAALALLASAIPGTDGHVWALALVAVALDFCVQLNMVISQREIYGLSPHHRSRVTAVVMTSIFIGGATGSSIAAPLVTGAMGWSAAALVAGGAVTFGALAAAWQQRKKVGA